MKVVFLKNNNFLNYYVNDLRGYIFKPRNKKIYNLNIVDKDIIKYILSKKIKKEISRTDKAISLMLESDITMMSDCDLMIDEIHRIAKKLENQYIKYFNEFDYYVFVKDLYRLNMEILLKKKLIEEIEL